MAASDLEVKTETEVIKPKAFQKEIKKAVEGVKNSITKAITKVEDKLSKLAETVELIAENVNAAWKLAQANKEKIKVLQEQTRKLKTNNEYVNDKLMDLENRARRSNSRLKNVPETEDMEKVVEWMANLLPELGISKDSLNRIHRAGKLRNESNWPRDVIMRFGRYTHREQVFKALKNLDRLDKLLYNGKKVMVFEDLSLETIKRKMNLRAFTMVLQEKDMKNNWRMAPFALRMQYKGETLYAKDQQQMVALFKHVGLQLPKDFKGTPDLEENDLREEREQTQGWQKRKEKKTEKKSWDFRDRVKYKK
ncbi:Hypothetical predicted protein [Podarcis lilfordi]|uniref:L1 transposable element RRM domain-containing protein n=1 Tax=Podarcis lilfordi TaxID=74358 RepID=A0AA35LNV3_9SAUR|nr:Hypothetical predicted protein [Podarcis lilfordi]